MLVLVSTSTVPLKLNSNKWSQFFFSFCHENWWLGQQYRQQKKNMNSKVASCLSCELQTKKLYFECFLCEACFGRRKMFTHSFNAVKFKRRQNINAIVNKSLSAEMFACCFCAVIFVWSRVITIALSKVSFYLLSHFFHFHCNTCVSLTKWGLILLVNVVRFFVCLS